MLGDHRDSAASSGGPVLNASKMLCLPKSCESSTQPCRERYPSRRASPDTDSTPERSLGAADSLRLASLGSRSAECQRAISLRRDWFSDPSQPSKSQSDTFQVPYNACRARLQKLVCRRRYRLFWPCGAVAKSAYRERRGQSYAASLQSFVFRHRHFTSDSSVLC